jgi:taurine dioxygenase
MSQFAVTPLTTTIGARVEGLNLGRRLDETTARAIRAALAEHLVLTFPGQHLDLEQQKAFTRIFGELSPILSHKLVGEDDTTTVLDNKLWSTAAAERLPSRFEIGDEYQPVGWHTDSTYCPEIASVTTLRAEVLPPAGGGTCWSSMIAAYDALSPAMQAWLEMLHAVHAPPTGQRAVLRVSEQPRQVQEEWDRELSARRHPMVVVHPATGRKLLFVNPGYTIKVDELSKSESANLLRFLFQHCCHPEFIFRHRWNEGDIVAWDHLATLHRAPNDYLPHERRVVRMTAGLTRPTGVGEQERLMATAAE